MNCQLPNVLIGFRVERQNGRTRLNSLTDAQRVNERLSERMKRTCECCRGKSEIRVANFFFPFLCVCVARSFARSPSSWARLDRPSRMRHDENRILDSIFIAASELFSLHLNAWRCQCSLHVSLWLSTTTNSRRSKSPCKMPMADGS